MRVVNLLPTALVVLAALLAWRAAAQVAQPLLLILLALIVAAGLNPLVVWANARLGLPRAVSAAVLLFLLIGGLGLLGWLLIPTLVTQLASLAAGLPGQVQAAQAGLLDLAERTPVLRGAADSLRELDLAGPVRSALPGTLAGVLDLTSGLLSGLLLGVLLLLLGFFVLVQPEPLIKGALSGVPDRYRDDAGRTLVRVGGQLGGWLVATLLLSLAMAALVGLGLTALVIAGVPVQNVFLFAVIAGVTQVIPVVGPLFGLIPPVLASLSPSPMDALWVGLVVFAAQQLVFQLLTPIVFSRGVSLHPASLLAGVLVFSGLFGIVGAFLAVPFLIIVKALYEELYLPTLDGPRVTAAEVTGIVEGEAPAARD